MKDSTEKALLSFIMINGSSFIKINIEIVRDDIENSESILQFLVKAIEMNEVIQLIPFVQNAEHNSRYRIIKKKKSNLH